MMNTESSGDDIQNTDQQDDAIKELIDYLLDHISKTDNEKQDSSYAQFNDNILNEEAYCQKSFQTDPKNEQSKELIASSGKCGEKHLVSPSYDLLDEHSDEENNNANNLGKSVNSQDSMRNQELQNIAEGIVADVNQFQETMCRKMKKKDEKRVEVDENPKQYEKYSDRNLEVEDLSPVVCTKVEQVIRMANLLKENRNVSTDIVAEPLIDHGVAITSSNLKSEIMKIFPALLELTNDITDVDPFPKQLEPHTRKYIIQPDILAKPIDAVVETAGDNNGFVKAGSNLGKLSIDIKSLNSTTETSSQLNHSRTEVVQNQSRSMLDPMEPNGEKVCNKAMSAIAKAKLVSIFNKKAKTRYKPKSTKSTKSIKKTTAANVPTTMHSNIDVPKKMPLPRNPYLSPVCVKLPLSTTESNVTQSIVIDNKTASILAQLKPANPRFKGEFSKLGNKNKNMNTYHYKAPLFVAVDSSVAMDESLQKILPVIAENMFSPKNQLPKTPENNQELEDIAYLKKYLHIDASDLMFWKTELKKQMPTPPTTLQFQNLTDRIQVNNNWYYKVQWCKYTWEKGDSLENSELKEHLDNFNTNSKSYKHTSQSQIGINQPKILDTEQETNLKQRNTVFSKRGDTGIFSFSSIVNSNKNETKTNSTQKGTTPNDSINLKSKTTCSVAVQVDMKSSVENETECFLRDVYKPSSRGQKDYAVAASSLLAPLLALSKHSNDESDICFELESLKKQKLLDCSMEPTADAISHPPAKKRMLEQHEPSWILDPYFNQMELDQNLQLTPILLAVESKNTKHGMSSFKEFDFAGTIAKAKVPRTIAGQQEKDFNCQHCGVTFGGSLLFTKHNSLFAKCKCPQCGVRICNKKKLVNHIRCHTETAYQCYDCLKAFPSKETFLKHKGDKHLKTHKSSQQLNVNRLQKDIWRECTPCRKKFKTYFCYLRHRKKHCKYSPNLLKGTYHCGVCLKSFGQEWCFRLHVNCHEAASAVVNKNKDPLQLNEEKNPQQTNQIAAYSILRRNNSYTKVVFSQRKKYCMECLKGFLNRDAFYQHINVKTCAYLKNNGQCMLCKKFFRSLDNLKSHVTNCFKESITSLCKPQSRNNSTIDDSPSRTRAVYHCSRCKTMFPSSFTFKKHKMLFHSKRTMYKCTKCNFKCCSRNLFKKHIKKRLCPKIDSFPCFCCEQSRKMYPYFDSLDNLYKHLKAHKVRSMKKTVCVASKVEAAEITATDGKKKKLLSFSPADINKLKGKYFTCTIPGFGTYHVTCKPIDNGVHRVIACRVPSNIKKTTIPVSAAGNIDARPTHKKSPKEKEVTSNSDSDINKSERNVKCFSCNRRFSNISHVFHHFHSYHKFRCVQIRKCDLCNIAFKDEDWKDYHMKHTHPYKTTGSDTSSTETLLTLWDVKTPMKCLYICIQCDLPFLKPADLQQHKIEVHSEDVLTSKTTYPEIPVKWPCSFCQKDINDVFTHAKKHTITMLECYQCNVKVTNKSALIRHFQTTHSTEWTGQDDKWLQEVVFYNIEATVRTMYQKRKLKAATTRPNNFNAISQKFRCPNQSCQMVFYHEKTLERHRLICKLSPKKYVFTSPSLMDQPGASVQGKAQTPSLTPVANTSPSSVVVVERSSDAKLTTCPICCAIFPDGQIIEDHMADAHDMLPVCATMTEIISKRHEIDATKAKGETNKTMTADYPFKCNVCDLLFLDEFSMWQDKMAHVGIEVETCYVCLETFTNELALVMHSYSKHRLFLCLICRKGFHLLDQIESHCQLHVYEVNIPRDDKGKMIIEVEQDTNLSKEKLLSTEQFHNNNCPTFYVSSKLPKPVLQDSNLFFCNVCCKNIEGELTFIVHLKTHSLNRQLLCFVCHKKFADYNSLQKHIAKHGKVIRDFRMSTTGDNNIIPSTEEDSICRFCSEVFQSKKLLDQHSFLLSSKLVTDDDILAGNRMVRVVKRYVDQMTNASSNSDDKNYNQRPLDWQLAIELKLPKIYSSARKKSSITKHVRNSISNSSLAFRDTNICYYCLACTWKKRECHMQNRHQLYGIAMKCAYCTHISTNRDKLIAHVKYSHSCKRGVRHSCTANAKLYCEYCNLETDLKHLKMHHHGLTWHTKKIRCSFCKLIFTMDSFSQHMKKSVESNDTEELVNNQDPITTTTENEETDCTNGRKLLQKKKKSRKYSSIRKIKKTGNKKDKLKSKVHKTSINSVESIPDNTPADQTTFEDNTTFSNVTTNTVQVKEIKIVEDINTPSMLEAATSEGEEIAEKQNALGMTLYISLTTGIKKPVCKLCDWEFSTYEELKMHILKHALLPDPISQNLERHVSCHLCTNVIRRTSMKTHLALKHYKDVMAHKRMQISKKMNKSDNQKQPVNIIAAVEQPVGQRAQTPTESQNTKIESNGTESGGEWEVLEEPAVTSKAKETNNSRKSKGKGGSKKDTRKDPKRVMHASSTISKGKSKRGRKPKDISNTTVIQKQQPTNSFLSAEDEPNIFSKPSSQENTIKKIEPNKKNYIMSTVPLEPEYPYPFTCMVCGRGYFTRCQYLTHFKLSHPWLHEAERERLMKNRKKSVTKENNLIPRVAEKQVERGKSSSHENDQVSSSTTSQDNSIFDISKIPGKVEADDIKVKIETLLSKKEEKIGKKKVGRQQRKIIRPGRPPSAFTSGSPVKSSGASELVNDERQDFDEGVADVVMSDNENDIEMEIVDFQLENSVGNSMEMINEQTSEQTGIKDAEQTTIKETAANQPMEKITKQTTTPLLTTKETMVVPTVEKQPRRKEAVEHTILKETAAKTDQVETKQTREQTESNKDGENHLNEETAILSSEDSNKDSELSKSKVKLDIETTDVLVEEKAPLISLANKDLKDTVLSDGSSDSDESDKEIEEETEEEIIESSSDENEADTNNRTVNPVDKTIETENNSQILPEEVENSSDNITTRNYKNISEAADSQLITSASAPYTTTAIKSMDVKTAKSSTLVTNLTTVTNVNNTSIQTYPCHQCSAMFYVENDLTEHVKIHNAKSENVKDTPATVTNPIQTYPCHQCSAMFYVENDLTEHVKIHNTKSENVKDTPATVTNPIQTYPCQQCSAMFYAENDLTEHVKVHNAKSEYTKDTLLFTTKTSDNQSNVNPEGTNIDSTTENEMDSMATDTIIPSVSNYKCPNCDVIFYSGADLKEHLPLHNTSIKNGEAPAVSSYPCQICNAVFYSEIHLQNHLPSHDSSYEGGHFKIKYPFVCIFCGIGFYGRSPLKSHMMTKHQYCYAKDLEKGKAFINLDYEGGGFTNKADLPKRSRSKFEQLMKAMKSPARKSAVPVAIPSNSFPAPPVFPSTSQPLEVEPQSSTMNSGTESSSEKRMSGRKRAVNERVLNILNPKKKKVSPQHKGLTLKIKAGQTAETTGELEKSKSQTPKEEGDDSSSSNEEENESNTDVKGEFNFTCKYCDQLFRTKANMAKHIQRHYTGSEVNKLTCVACFCLINRYQLKWHMHTSHEELKLSQRKKFCAHCNYSSKKGLEKHILEVHPSLLKIECRICDARFSTTSSYNKHFQMTHGKSLDEETLMCLFCNKKFQSLTKLYCHFSIIHMKKNKHLYCALCSKYFYGRTDLKNHQDEFHQNDKYQCGLCLVDFESVAACEKHVLVHKTQTNFQCNFCKFYFETKYSLDRHSATHEEIFKCKVCDRCFKNVTEYQSHKEINKCNSTTKVYCVLCDESFESEEDLLDHTKVHSMRKNYQCTSCEKSFKTLSEIQEHIEESHQGGPSGTDKDPAETSVYETDTESDERLLAYSSNNQCDKCDETFIRHEIYLEHMKKHNSSE